MINRPKPPPHILKRLKAEEAEKKAKREKRNRAGTSSSTKDPKNLTTFAFGKDLQTDNNQDAFNTQYPFKGLTKIPEKVEDETERRAKKKHDYMSNQKSKRGKSMNPKSIQSNGFAKTTGGNSTAYQSNFNDADNSTTTSKNMFTSPVPKAEYRKNYQRSESLIARSACYSQVPCPH